MKKLVLCFSLIILGLFFYARPAKAMVVYDKPEDWYQFYTEEATAYMETNFSTIDEMKLTYTYAKKAVERTIFFYGFSGSGDDSDAFRHTYWSALMTMHFAKRLAKEISDRNELKSTSALDSDMDYNNNEVGRGLYEVWKENYQNIASSDKEDDLAFFIAQAVLRGDHYGIKKISGNTLIATNSGYRFPAYAEHTDSYDYYDDFLHTHSCTFCGVLGNEDHSAVSLYSANEVDLYALPAQKYCYLCRHYYGF